MTASNNAHASPAAGDPDRLRELEASQPRAIHGSWARRAIPIGAVLAAIAYLVFSVFYFEVPRVIREARFDLIELYALDLYAYKVHVTKEVGEPEAVTVQLEGSRLSEYDEPPAWVSLSGDTQTVDLGDSGSVTMQPGLVTIRPADAKPIRVRATEDGVKVLSGDVPDRLQISELKVDARLDTWARVQITKSKVEVHRYFLGWANFFYTFDSELKGKSLGELVDLAFFSDKRLSFDMPNWQFILAEFWGNPLWQHGAIFWAMVQTLIMAIVGTLCAALIALPLSFAAAYNVNPLKGVRFGVQRLFDSLRAVDHLIWSLIFIRAFGLGPLSGIFAFMFTETGTFGKLFSEAVENIDRREPEGVQATGASRLQKYRFGVLPQILPVFVSQLLYFFESNTRSATIVGALGAGGIGLKLMQTIQTRQDWENTLYIVTIIVLTVIAMDSISGWLRRRLIGAPESN
ncbi:phosphonate ABC transporter, permease protein PhnE [Rhodovibrio sodomensis]|uniref:Phosphonate ABC transporter, permease protein PhnE n=1 Tax=Rhodovibrio sodomensis TaxID=1088 RepID=A0ABS1DA11_9PROT|nr:phosphonate ABC transporter, permease protein PhnE [Rhodovibrio sodomensis]MBK1667269.1 phosphonate ABC transporter, permease protein PhnE [Rhodovibrio sodomensis]